MTPNPQIPKQALDFQRQMLEFQKATFDNTYATITMFQEQQERLLKMFLDQSPWLPDEGKKLVGDWLYALKKGRQDFKNTVDQSFNLLRDYLERLSQGQ